MSDVRGAETLRAYQRLFLDDGGQVSHDGELVLRDLERECKWMPQALRTTKDGFIDPIRVGADAEKRLVYAHIKKMLATAIIKED